MLGSRLRVLGALGHSSDGQSQQPSKNGYRLLDLSSIHGFHVPFHVLLPFPSLLKPCCSYLADMQPNWARNHFRPLSCGTRTVVLLELVLWDASLHFTARG